MNEQAIQDAFALFQQNGYKKSIDDFKTLIKTNPQALSDSYSLFQENGYKKDLNSFKSLMGVSVVEKKNQVGTSTSTKPTSVSATPQPTTKNISVGGKKVGGQPSGTSASRPSKDEFAAWDKAFREQKAKEKTISQTGVDATQGLKPIDFNQTLVQEEKKALDYINANVSEQKAKERLEKAKTEIPLPTTLTYAFKKELANRLNPLLSIFNKEIDVPAPFLYKPLEEEEDIALNEFKSMGVNPSREQLNKRAEELFIQRDILEQKKTFTDSYMNNELAGRDDIKEGLKIKAIQDNLNSTSIAKQRQALAKIESEQALLLQDEYNQLLEEKKTLKTNEQIIAFNQKAEDFRKRAEKSNKTLQYLEASMPSVMKKAENDNEKLELFKLNYDLTDSSIQGVIAGFENLVGGSAKLLLSTLQSPEAMEKTNSILLPLYEISGEIMEDAEKRMLPFRRIALKDVDSWFEFGRYSSQLFSDQAPIYATMALGGVVGLGAVTMSSGGQKIQEMEDEEKIPFGRRYTDFEKLTSGWLYAGAEFFPEKIGTFRMLENIKDTYKTLSKRNRSLFVDGWATTLTKGITSTGVESLIEGGTEGLTSMLQDGVDRYLLGKPIAERKSAEKLFESVVSGKLMGGATKGLANIAMSSMVLKEFSDREDISKTRELMQQINAYANELEVNLNLTEQDKKDIGSKIEDLTNQVNDVIKNSSKKASKLPKEMLGVIADINNRHFELREEAERINATNLSTKLKKQELDKLEKEFRDLDTKRQRILKGDGNVLDTLTDKEVIDLKDQAQRELVKEAKAEGKTEFTFDDKQITERAIELYNQKQKQDERQVSNQEGVSPTETETVSTEDAKDGVQPQEKVKTEGDAIQEQSTDEGLLQPKQSEVGLQEVEQGDQKQVQATNQAEKIRALKVSEVRSQKDEIKNQTYTKQEVDRIKSIPVESEDGATMNLNGTKYEQGGLVIPLASKNMNADELTPEAIADFVNDNAESIGADNVKVGIYKFPNSNQVSIDLNIVADPSMRDEALAIGKELGQESLFDLDTFENIKTGADGMNPKKLTPSEFKAIQERLRTKSPNQNSITISPKDTDIDNKISGASNTNVAKAVAKAAKAVSKILPNIKFVLHNTNESFTEMSGESKNQTSNGLYKNGEIHINLEKANARTVAHEVFHAILLDKVKTDSKAAQATKRMIDALAPILDKNTALKRRLDEFADNYDENIQNEEKLAELVGVLAENYNSLSNRVKEIIKDWLNNLAKIFGVEVFESNEVLDVLKTIAKGVATGKQISSENVRVLTSGVSNYISEPVTITPRKSKSQGNVVVGNHSLSFVKKSDLFDIESLIDDIYNKKQKVWFWVADQLGRGMYFDEKINGEHYLDAGISYALDPENRNKKIIWATGKNEKEINRLINSSDYIFIISGSPTKSKLFNKTVFDILSKRISNFSKFKKDILSVSKIKPINNILSSVKSWDELKSTPKRKDFLIAVLEQENKNTELKSLLSKYNAFINLNDIRDGFLVDNDFKINDIMLVLKPTKMGGKSKHSTYENDILGEVVGVPNKKINAFDIMPEELKSKYQNELTESQKQQAIAPYGLGIRGVEPRKQKNIPEKVSEKLTEDKDGNFVFKHYSDERRDVIKRGKGDNRITSREEASALNAVDGLAMFYTMDGQVESGVGSVEHTVLVSKDKVYDIDSDPLGFEAEAKRRFEKRRPNQAFSDNYRAAFITQIANENGFDLAVTQWRGTELRGQTTLELKPEEKNTPFKDRPLPTFEVGDMAIIDGKESVILDVDGIKLSYQSLDGTERGTTINNERNRRSIIKLEDTPVTKISKELAEKIRGLKTRGGVNLRMSIIGVDAIIAKVGAKIWNEAMEFLATEVENGTAIGVAVEKTSKKITELVGNANWGASKFKSAMKQHLGFEAQKELISDLRGALAGAIATTQFLTSTRRIEESKLKKAKSKALIEIRKRFEGLLPKDVISSVIRAVNALDSKGDIDSQLDALVDKVNNIINENEKNVRVREALIKRKQGIRNIKKGTYSLNSLEAKIIAMNPKVVLKLGEKFFDVYFEALNQLSSNAKVAPLLSFASNVDINKINLVGEYFNLQTKINENQLLVNEKVERLLQNIENATSDAEVNDLIKEFREDIDNYHGSVKEFLSIPSDNELKGVDSESETEQQKQEVKELLIDMISDDIRGVVADISNITKNPASKVYEHIKFLEELVTTEKGRAFLNGLSNTNLTNLYNAVLNLSESKKSDLFINDLSNKYKIGENTGEVTLVVEEVSKKGGAIDSLIKKGIGKVLALFDSLRIVGSQETLKGVTNQRERLFRNLLNSNLPEIDKALGNVVNKNLYKHLFDGLAKAIGKYISTIKPIMNKLDDLQGELERSKDVEVSNVKLVYYALSVMRMSNLQNKKIGNIVEHFKHTIAEASVKNSDWADKLQEIFDKHIAPFIVTTNVTENSDGTVTIEIEGGEGIKNGVNVQTKDKNGALVNQKVNLVNGKATITIPNSPNLKGYLVVTPNNYLSPLEQKVYDKSREILKGIEWMSEEAMVYQNGRMNQMSENYVPMSSHSGGSSNIDSIIDNLINSITKEALVPDSGNLMPLESGKKHLKTTFIQNIKGVVKGVALQHSVKDEAYVAIKTAQAVARQGSKSNNKTSRMVSNVIYDFTLVAVKNSLMRANIPNAIQAKLRNAFYTIALAVVQSRVVDFSLNNLRYAIINPLGYGRIVKKGFDRFKPLFTGKRAKSTMQKIADKVGMSKEDVVNNLVKNMKATDAAGLISGDMSSTMQGITSDKTMRADSTKEFYSTTEKALTKINALLFKNSLVKFVQGVNTIIASLSDTALKRDIFLEEFNEEFKNITGEDIDLEAMAKGDVAYISKNQQAINKASTKANGIVSILTGSSNPLERTLLTNIQVGGSTLGQLKKETSKGDMFNKFIDNVDVLFAGFMRSIYAQYVDGVRDVTSPKSFKQARVGLANIVAATATVSLYKAFIEVLTSFELDQLHQAFVYDDEEEKEDANKLSELMDKAREDKEVTELLFELGQVDNIIGGTKEETNELRVRETERLVKKLQDNKVFRDYMVFKLSEMIYKGVIEQIKTKANSIAKELEENPLSTKGKYEVKEYTNVENIVSVLGYLYSEAGSKEPNVKEDRLKMKKMLMNRLLTGTDLKFEDFVKQIDKEDNGFKNSYYLEAAKVLSEYRTKEEMIIQYGLSDMLNFNLGRSGGNLGRTVPNIIGYSIEEEAYKTLRQPFDRYNPDIKFLEDIKDEEATSAKKSATIGQYAFKKLFPATESVLSKAVKINDIGDNGVSFVKLASLLLAPASQDALRLINKSEKDIKRQMITNDKLKSPMLNKEVGEFDDLDLDMIDISEITRNTRKKLDTVNTKKFGGN